jgi:monoamine oxidase
MADKVDVIIIGGGYAGLAALHYLQKNESKQLSIVLIDARDRLGGRTKTMQHSCQTCGGRSKVDVGGQFIGPSHERLLSLIDEFGLTLQDQEFTIAAPSNETAAHRHCSLIECAHYPLYSTCVGDDVDRFMQMVASASAEMDLAHPWLHPRAHEWNAQSVHDVVMLSTQHVDAQAELLLFTQTVLACAPARLSFLFFIFYVASSGGIEALGDGDAGAQRWKLLKGAQHPCERMAQRAQACANVQLQLLLQCKVVGIDIQDGTSAVVSCQVGDHDQVTTQQFHAKRVIFAASPALIHPQRIAFNPPLSAEKAQIYESMGSGACVKIVVVYHTAFWKDDAHGGLPSSTISEAHSSSFGPVHNIFMGNVCCQPALVCLSTGDCALALHKCTSEERIARVIAQLARMYGPAAASYEACFEEDWQSSSLSGGCFAGVFPPHAPLLDHWSELQTPHANVVYFASTETSMHFYGYIEGAIRSGERAAREVISSLNK